MIQPSIEARKLSIIQILIELQEEQVIQQIENILKLDNNFGEQLSDQDKQSINQGIKELNKGKRTEFEDFISQLRNRKQS